MKFQTKACNANANPVAAAALSIVAIILLRAYVWVEQRIAFHSRNDVLTSSTWLIAYVTPAQKGSSSIEPPKKMPPTESCNAPSRNSSPQSALKIHVGSEYPKKHDSISPKASKNLLLKKADFSYSFIQFASCLLCFKFYQFPCHFLSKTAKSAFFDAKSQLFFKFPVSVEFSYINRNKPLLLYKKKRPISI